MNSPTDSVGPTRAYVLGHSDRELDRLGAQARLIEPITRQFFRDAGIAPGMRILDVGSGAGDVAFLAADLVGNEGEVVGTDRAPAAIAGANARAQARRLGNVHFHEGDPAEMAFDRPFDAVVGRYVLLFQADPAATVRRLARHLQPGGVIVFHEPDLSFVRSFPPAPLYDRCCRWVAETFRLAGTEANMAERLYAAFVHAQLPAPTMRMHTVIGGGAGIGDWLNAVADLAGSVLQAMEQLGVATAAEVDVATLAERMGREIETNGSLILGRSEIGAWSRP